MRRAALCVLCMKPNVLLLTGLLVLSLSPSLQAEYEIPSLPAGLNAEKYIVPADNLMTEAKIELGRSLFFDTRLSFDNSVSCATCHSHSFAFSDNRRVSNGINLQEGSRNAPTILNRVFSTDQFWDGRAASLEEQAIEPMTNPVEMGMPSLDYVVNTIQDISGYRSWFKEVFGHDVNIEDVAKAIACFERTLVSGNSPFDRFVSGDENALDESAKRGLKLFEGKARCDQCHSRPLFTDEKYHNIGIDWDTDIVDLGRYRVTGRADDIGAFKTPTLREIALTGPYMHDGSLATLEDTIDFYDRGGNSNPFLDIEMRRPTRSLDEVLAFYENRQSSGNEDTPEIELEKLNLTSQERTDLVSFLNSLSGRGWQHVKPPDHFPK